MTHTHTHTMNDMTPLGDFGRPLRDMGTHELLRVAVTRQPTLAQSPCAQCPPARRQQSYTESEVSVVMDGMP